MCVGPKFHSQGRKSLTWTRIDGVNITYYGAVPGHVVNTKLPVHVLHMYSMHIRQSTNNQSNRYAINAALTFRL